MGGTGVPPGGPPANLGTGRTPAYRDPGRSRPAEGVRPTGPAAAAVVAAGLGALTLGGATLLAAALVPFDQGLVDAGRLFLPGGAHLGRFGGQQLLALVAWLAGWALLHRRWRARQVSLTATAAVLVVCVVVATLLMWPPLTRPLVALAR